MKDAEFADMVQKYQKLIYSICFQMVQDYHIAEDLTQETFLSAYSHLQSCPTDHIRPWLAKIATNKAKDHLKSAYSRKVLATEKEEMADGLCLHMKLPENPADLAVSNQQKQEICSLVESLKEPYRSVAVMYFLKEKKVEEISKLLNRSPKTVHTQIYRAKGMLQKQLLERSVQI